MWPNPQFPADLVTFTEEILNGKLHFFVQWKKNTLVKCEESRLKKLTKRAYSKTLDEGRNYIETSPMGWFLYDRDLRHKRFKKTHDRKRKT